MERGKKRRRTEVKTIQCGWCPGTPVCTVLEQGCRCPSCKRFYVDAIQGKAGDEIVATLKLGIQKWPEPKVGETFNFADFLTSPKRKTKKFMEWLKEQSSKKIVDPQTKTPLDPMDTRWTYYYNSQEWIFDPKG